MSRLPVAVRIYKRYTINNVFCLGGVALYRSTFAIVDERAIWHNVRQIRSFLGPGKRLLVAVKANGYGHGALPAAEAALSAGATDLGVASVEEALVLRKGGIAAPILVFGAVPPEAAQMAANWQIAIALVDDWSELDLPLFDPPLHVHVKVDTGMNRLGFRSPDEVLRIIRWLRTRSDIELAGVFTHLAKADAEELDHAQAQIDRFDQVLETLQNAGVDVPVVHAAQSAAALRRPDWHYDMVRVGISAYGYAPSPFVPLPVPLVPALHLYSFISRLVVIQKGETVGYGAAFTAERETQLATLPVGYADGYPRFLSNRAEVVVHGQRARVVGTVCMDQLMIDVTDVDNVLLGDAVTLYGRPAPVDWTAQDLAARQERDQEDWLIRTFCMADPSSRARAQIAMAVSPSVLLERSPSSTFHQILSLDELAGIGNTISYELMCALSTRVPRVYVKHYFDIRNSGSV